MKAAVLRKVGAPLTVEHIEHDDPGPFEVVVRVAAAGLCHSDIRFMEGSYPVEVPAVLGHESAGIVEQTGSRVTHVSVGDHVVTFLSVFCGACSYCVTGRSHLCANVEATRRSRDEPPRLTADGMPLHQFLDLGSFSERMLIHENALVKVTEEIPLDRAALLGCGVATGLGSVFNAARVRPGESVAVIGCGGVGLSAIQGARIAGADPIIAIDRIDEKLDLANSLGATHVINSASVDPLQEVMRLTAGALGVDKSFEAVGRVDTAELAFDLLRPDGTATLIGLIPVGEKVQVPGRALLSDRRLQGTALGSNQFRVDVPRYVQMYIDGRLNLDDMVTRTLPLEDINEGFSEMLTGKVARNVVVFD